MSKRPSDFSYFELKAGIHDDLIRYQQKEHRNSFHNLQSIISFLLDSFWYDYEPFDIMIYIALGIEAIGHGEISSHVNRKLLEYIDNDTLHKYKDEYSDAEFEALREDLDRFKKLPPESLREVRPQGQ